MISLTVIIFSLPLTTRQKSIIPCYYSYFRRKKKKRLLKASTQQSKSLLAVSFAIYHEASNLLVAGGVARWVESESKVSK